MNSPTPIVFVVDDDEHVRNALCRLLRSGGYAAEAYGSASAFLHGADLTGAPACLLLDLQLPDLSGIELQQRLEGRVPIVFVSGHGDMNTAVRAMKAGASDFLTKPIDAQVLFEATSRALERACHLYEQREQRAEIQRRVEKLTPREREVMALVVTGRPNKLVADELGAAEKTIKIHRARVMEKMKADSLADLVRLMTTFDADAREPHPLAHTG
ncbi:response regulator transcription factor [Paraburkholderia silvatlantica]|uniref:FixJ family two-component response regulator n=1 Tax=Paraburkholderia silvatlantica TaxID=321895 RepID=A0ABR6FI24_9BURK|nr:response regulator [Paraburkholderia silvatlantica]MBB2926430.1 FixJ family two-component response regulator [Paraburkholderia silvatlantica]PVY25025.1 LuxR family two component transcriptional regulator [Paraburkholderia silvatlantica]PXW30109.1 LuxR family two component transcriptional regulator [Paraburkholderia silvatlantica]